MSGNAQTARGTVKEGLTVKSKILSKDVRYTIYLPYDYNTSDRLYPVVYLLHGYTDNDIAWIQFGEANRIADEGIAAGDFPPMIIVMPDAGVSWYMNNFDNSVRYEDFFIEEFIPQIESIYRIRKDRQFRAVSGLSMGGYGSILYSFKHPDLFSSVAAFSAAIYTEEEVLTTPDDRWEAMSAILYGKGLKGEARLTDHLKKNNPLIFTKELSFDKLKWLRIYVDCGDDDFLYKGNDAFHTLLRDQKIPHEYRVRNGTHSWEYWRTGLPEALKFIGQGFKR